MQGEGEKDDGDDLCTIHDRRDMLAKWHGITPYSFLSIQIDRHGMTLDGQSHVDAKCIN
jgi:hypothetical protein